MKLTSHLFTSRKISLAAASFLSLASIATAAVPYADANPFERSEWGILNNDIFFGGVDALFGLSPASRTLLLTSTSESETTSDSSAIVTQNKTSADLFSFASSLGSPFAVARGFGGSVSAPNAITADQTWDGGASGNGTAWFTTSNWVGDAAFAGSTSVTTNTDIASIPSTGTNPNIGINGTTHPNLYLGAINFSGANRTIGDSANGNLTLTLNGATVNAVSNVILRNSGAGTLNLVPQSSSNTGAMSIALGNATDNIINIDGTGGITISSVIKDGAGNDLTLGGAGSGVLTLLGNNTYTGTTTINSGTLNAGATGALGGTTNVVVNGGTLLFSGATNNRINDAATMTLNGGTLNTAGLSEHGAMNNDAGIGALTLMSSSIIDMANGASILAFADSSGSTWTGTLSIYNWSGTPFSGNGTDQLYFGNSNGGLTGAQLNQISFYSDAGTTFLGTAIWGADNDGEVVPVPEPGTWIGAALALAAVGFTQRRRLRGLITRGA